MSSFVIHIHLYLTTEDTERMAYDNLKRLKNAGFKILVTSPKPLPQSFYKYIDHYYYDSENQLMKLDYVGAEPIIWWNHSSSFTFNFVIDGFQKHGLTVLRSMIKGAKIAEALGYSNIIRFEFDDLFGLSSLETIKEVCKDIEQNSYDFYAYKNDYGGDRLNVSTHLIFYSTSSFSEVFGRIENEYDYKECLKQIGLEDRAILLEEFIYRFLQLHPLKVSYQDGATMGQLYKDTAFNMHQTPIGVHNGVLSDVMKIEQNGECDTKSLCLVAQNITSESPVTAYFDVYNNESILINTVEMHLQVMGEWRYEFLIDTENVGEIKIRHQDSLAHKTFKVYFNENGVNIVNIDLPSAVNWTKITFK